MHSQHPGRVNPFCQLKRFHFCVKGLETERLWKLGYNVYDVKPFSSLRLVQTYCVKRTSLGGLFFTHAKNAAS